jgi:hypothetical protein
VISQGIPTSRTKSGDGDNARSHFLTVTGRRSVDLERNSVWRREVMLCVLAKTPPALVSDANCGDARVHETEFNVGNGGSAGYDIRDYDKFS